MRNYLQKSRAANIINLNLTEKNTQPNSPKYKVGDVFVLKKVLNSLDAPNMSFLYGLDEFKKNTKIIFDIMIKNGKFLYSFSGKNANFIEEANLENNYLHHYQDNVWKYYKDKFEIIEIEKRL